MLNKYISKILVLMVLLTIPSVTHAVDISAFDRELKSRRAYLDYFVNGKDDILKFKRLSEADFVGIKERLCTKHLTRFLMIETDKSKYNDIFHEMDNAEQRADVVVLKERIEAAEDCIEKFQLWLEYDDKWYKEIRDAKFAERRKLEEQWAASVKDTGDDVYDVVIEGTHFAIPRKYIWLGSRRPDGYIVDVNLQFFFPEMGARPSNDPEYEGMRTNIGGLLQRDIIETKVCPSVEGKEVCTNNYVTRAGRPNTYWDMKCEKYGYYFPWLASCEFFPVFDEEVGLWTTKEENSLKPFYEGHYLFPDYSFECKRPPIAEEDYGKGVCDSVLKVRERVFFKYTFPRELFWKHREIHDALRTKLETFVVNEN